MGEQLSIHTLGGVIIERGGKLVTGFDTRKTVALLVYLAGTNRQHPRETIAEMLWEERTQSQSLHSLRPLLTNLRKTVGPYVTITRDAIGMKPNSRWWLDTNAFESGVSSTDIQTLAKALDLYQGEYLEGFYVDSQAFDEWRRIESERLHYTALDGFDRLVDHHLSQGDYAKGLKHAMSLLRLEPLRERTYYQLMRLLMETGQREAALKQYETCRRLLQAELGIDPTPDTTNLYRQILDGHTVHVRTQPDPRSDMVDVALVRHIDDVSARSRPPAQLIGRAPLIAEVEADLEAGDQILLQGFAGVGKTAIAATVAMTHLAQRDTPVLWIQAGRQRADDILEAVATCLSEENPPTEPVVSRLRAVLRLIDEHEVGLVVIDDCWNGEALDLVLQAIPSGVPVLVTSRHRFPLLQLIHVPMLKRPDSLEVLSFYAQHDWRSDPASNALCQLLRDLPFALRIAGIRLTLDNVTPKDIAEDIAAAPHEMAMPAGFERPRASLAALLQTSVTALNQDEHRAFLAFGLLYSPGATAELLSLILDQEERHVADALRGLQRRGLVEGARQPDSAIVYFGMHDLAYGYAKSRAPYDEAQEQAVREACRAFAVRHVDDIAVLHCERTNLLRAAEAAYKGHDYQNLISIMRALVIDSKYFSARGHDKLLRDQLDNAIGAARELGEKEVITLHYLLGKRGNACYECGELGKAIDFYQESGELAHKLGMYDRHILALCMVSKMMSKQGREREAEVGLERAYALAAEHGDPVCTGRVLENWAVHAYDHGHYEQARDLSIEAVQLAGEHQVRRRFYGLLNWGAAEQKLGRFEQSLQLFEEALGIACAEDEHAWQAHARYGLAEAYLEMGTYDKAALNIKEALDLFEGSGNSAKMHELLLLQQRLPSNTNDQRY